MKNKTIRILLDIEVVANPEDEFLEQDITHFAKSRSEALLSIPGRRYIQNVEVLEHE